MDFVRAWFKVSTTKAELQSLNQKGKVIMEVDSEGEGEYKARKRLLNSSVTTFGK